MSQPTTQQFVFVGATDTEEVIKVDWKGHPEVVAAILKAKMIDKRSSKDAFEIGRLMLDVDALPKSYSNKNAGSLFDGLKKRFLGQCNVGNKACVEAAKAAGLIQDVPVPVIEEGIGLEHVMPWLDEPKESETDN